MKKSILFISHDAGRTGAPLLLLSFLKWFKRETDIPFRVLLRNGGELETEFRALAPVELWNAQRTGMNLTRVTRAGLRRMGLGSALVLADRDAVRRRFPTDEIGLVYSNTCTNGAVLHGILHLQCPVITHVHELEYGIRCHGLDLFEVMKQHTRHYIAVSEAVKTNLVENHAIAAGDVNVIYGFTDVKSCTQLDPEQSRYRIRSALGIPRDAIVVGGAGGVGWHKGVDLFVQLAALINRRKIGNQVFFLWVGGPTQGRSFVETWSDVQRADVERVVKFTGFQPNPLEHFAAMDILALTSREDSFPLVVLEAAALGVPAVCFDRAGGACEFVSPDCGFVVPYLDVDAFAHKVWSLLEVPELRKEMGERARQKVQENHDITVIAPKLLKVIERYYGS